MSSPRLLPIPRALRRNAMLGIALLAPALSFANPSGGVVVGGQASIGKPAPNGTVIQQTSTRAIIDWQKFDIGRGEYVRFVQPSASSVALNRILGGSASEIFGQLSANGRVFLVNPSGIVFAPGASVDVGGLLASTLDIRNDDFLAGNYAFKGDGGGGAISNAGRLQAHDGGFVALVGDRVSNAGLIQARLGQVVLAAGSAVTLNLGGSGLVSFAVDQAALSERAGVSNVGALLADGGRVLMTAATARQLVGSAVNNSGVIRAESIAEHDGAIELVAAGGDLVNRGVLDASAQTARGDGGQVSLKSDHDIALLDASRIAANGGAQGSGGRVRVLANGDTNVAQSSSLAATGGRRGGFAELSGHGALHLQGRVRLGAGGTLLLDPTDITIVSGGGQTDLASPFNTDDATITENFVEQQLDAGTSLILAATHSIRLQSLLDGVLDGSQCGGVCGNLLLGIGETTGTDFTRGAGSADGGIFFDNLANTIKLGGDLSLIGGSAAGRIAVGALQARDLTINNHDAVSTGAINARSVGISSAAGAISVGDIDAGGAITLNAAGNLSAGALAAAGAVTLTLDGNADIGAVSGANITLSAAHDLSLNGAQLNAVSRLTITSGGAFSDSSSHLSGQSVALTAAGAMSLQNDSVSGNQLRLKSGGDLSLDTSVLGVAPTAQGPVATTPTRVQLDSAGAIHLANSSGFTADEVALTAAGAVDARGQFASTVDAGALSVRGSRIDLADVVFNIGNGLADFGSDPAILARLRAVAPRLLPLSVGPNASFAATGTVSIGSIHLGGGYLFVQASFLTLPSPTGAGNLFINYLPSNPAAAFGLGTLDLPPGITTLLIGGSTETGLIQIGNGTQTFNIPSGTNFVFATQGLTRFPEAILTRGQVVVLGPTTLVNPPASPDDLARLPLDDTQFRPEEDDTVKAPTGRGQPIEVRDSSGTPSACAVGGAS